ncbi:SDR family NAD(P)-dependent oxidoreductase [Anaerococcus porci]|uniref:SDR family NAD(P)-dependent oxidoreductase n=1 Tax=Anaerococcus porci TaxID=2652269 RepID=UPI002A758FFB|nr:SDR family NAD(P)-dependent oxidoreductase [Anaerococcus porci]MDY3007379.1 SDR family NAD(P)-dependent oxidoreductase [Anaerococcus porci]
MDLNLKDKVVLITVSTGGIGKAITKAFYKEGAKLALTSTRKEKVDKLIEELGNPPEDKVRGYVLDITNEEEVKRVTDQVVKDFGTLYSLVSNAGNNGDYQEIKDSTKENYDKVFSINVYGVLYSMKYAIPYMLENKKGSVVVLGSEGSYVGSPGMGAYVASKHAVAALVKTLATEVGGSGIHANYIAPSAVDTDMMRRIEKNTFGDSKTPEEAERFFAEASYDKRYAKPEEVANAALYLASEVSAHMMGWGLRLDGGKHIL